MNISKKNFGKKKKNYYWEKYNRHLLLNDEADSSKDYLLEVAESQLYMFYVIGDVEYKKIKYGEEESAIKSEYCGDCAIKKGYYHVFGCDLLFAQNVMVRQLLVAAMLFGIFWFENELMNRIIKKQVI